MSHSASTQTPWSWLKDLEEIARLKREHEGKLSLEMSSVQQMLDEEENARSPDLAAEDFGGVDDRADLTLRRDLQISHERGKEKATTSENEDANDKTLILPSIVNESEDRPKRLEHAEELVLPPIMSAVSSQVVETDDEEGDTISESMKAVSLSSIEQLEQLAFPFFEDKTAEDSDGESETEEPNNKAEDDEIDSCNSQSISPIPPRLKLNNLSWPSILQYLRESESVTSGYFSLNNKDAVESRLAENKRLQRTVTSEEAERLKSHQITSGGSEEGDTESDLVAAKSQICDFCGQSTTQVSLLQLAEDQDSQMAPLCCEEKKEFCVLMAVCMRQMITNLKQQRPKKISVELTEKVVKKTAEERALEMMRRQRKWEELRRKKEEIQQQTKLPKHVQLIQFSLLSAPEGEWMVRPESAMKHHTPKQKQEALMREKASKKKEKEYLRKGILLPKTIERLKQLHCKQTPCELKVLNYGDGKKFAVLLPDGTGQVYYHSGNQAIAIFSPYIGVLAYLIFEDSSQPCLLAYMDELGRITCYNSQANIRLLLRPREGLLYDGEDCQKCRKHWKWSSGEASVFQPFTLSLNKQLTVKLNSHEKFLLTFCGSKLNHIRFDVESKLKDDTMLSREIESVQLAQNYLSLVKNRISQLLQLIEQTSRPNVPTRKHSKTEGELARSDWKSIYSTKTRVQNQARSRTSEVAAPGRRRTKSTGGLALQKSPIKIRPLV